MESLLKIAKVSKSDGTDGAVILSFLSIAPEDLEISEPVFVYFDGLPVPFFIESFTRKGTNKAVVRLNDIHNYEDAEELVGKDVFIEDDSEYEDDTDLIGWTVATVNADITGEESGKKAALPAVLGKITDFLDIPGNPCIEVGTKNGAVTIPLHEDFIVSADPDTRTLVMTLPEGLL